MGVERRIRAGLTLGIRDETRLLSLIRARCRLEIDFLTSRDILDMRTAIDETKGIQAFGDAFENEPLKASLLWHFGFWKLKQLREADGTSAQEILAAGLCRDVVVLFADLGSFSSVVRDTRWAATRRRFAGLRLGCSWQGW